MKFSQSVAALAATASMATAAPVVAKRQAYAITDADIVRCLSTVD